MLVILWSTLAQFWWCSSYNKLRHSLCFVGSLVFCEKNVFYETVTMHSQSIWYVLQAPNLFNWRECDYSQPYLIQIVARWNFRKYFRRESQTRYLFCVLYLLLHFMLLFAISVCLYQKRNKFSMRSLRLEKCSRLEMVLLNIFDNFTSQVCSTCSNHISFN